MNDHYNKRPFGSVAVPLLTNGDPKKAVTTFGLGFGVQFPCCGAIGEGAIEAPPRDPKTFTREELDAAAAQLIDTAHRVIREHVCGEGRVSGSNAVSIAEDGSTETVAMPSKH